MIEKIKQFAELREELNEEYDVLSADKVFITNDIEAHIGSLTTLLNIANGEDVHVSDHSEEYPYRLSYYEDEVHFFCLLNETGYQEYKKATAVTVTKEKFDNL